MIECCVKVKSTNLFSFGRFEISDFIPLFSDSVVQSFVSRIVVALSGLSSSSSGLLLLLLLLGLLLLFFRHLTIEYYEFEP